MLLPRKPNGRAMLLFALLLTLCVSGYAQDSKTKSEGGTPILWRDPGNVSLRDLRYGPGSSSLAPAAPFRFIEEDKSGESPKFDVRDARGVKWSVKLGAEAQSETVASRLVWAPGYFAEETYYFERVRIRNLPKLSRGQKFVEGSTVRGARFEPRRSNVKRGKTWGWNENPFAGTRELDGLKVIMILLNNFDARAENNRILHDSDRPHEAQYIVSDLGATLGKAGGLGGTRTKNNLRDFLSTRFVTGIENGIVEFDYDTRPIKLGMLTIVYPPYYMGQVKKEKSMRGIPVEHARWIGSLLSQLTDEQLRDSFRAANYHPTTIDAYVRSLRQRITQLTQL